jgi:hypothetical protein
MIVGGASLAALMAALAPIYSYDAVATPRLPDWVTFSTSGHSCLFDSTGKLTYAPNQIALQSADFTQAAWSKTNTSATGAAGGYQLLARTSTASSAFVNQPGLLPRGARGIASVKVKLGTVGSLVGLRLQWTYPVRADIVADLSTGTIAYAQGLTGATLHASGIVALGGGEYQIYVCASPPSSDTAAGAVVIGSAAIANSAWEGASGGGGLIDVYAKQPRVSVVMHETAPRAEDDVEAGASAYYGPSFDYEWDNRLYFDETGAKTFKPNNLVLRSQEFDHASWIKTPAGTGSAASVTPNAATAPDGTVTADRIVFALNGGNTSGDISTVAQTAFVSGATIHSVWLRADTPCTLMLRNPANNGTASTINVTSAWTRFSIVGSQTLNQTNMTFGLRGGLGASDSATIFAWGAQVELVTYQTAPRDYRATTSSVYWPDASYVLNGLLIESEARTNSLRNSTMQGGVAGSPGSLPTNWAVSGLGTLTQTIAFGTEHGMPYVDVRFNGTTSTTSVSIFPEVNNNIAATTGQSWVASSFVKLAAGSLTNITSISQVLRENANTGVGLALTPTAFTPTSALQRVIAKRTLDQATAAFVLPYIGVNFSSGVAIDITLRIYQPQIERLALATTSAASSPIPTYGAAVTRAADTVYATLPALNRETGTMLVESVLPAFTASAIVAEGYAGGIGSGLFLGCGSAGSFNYPRVIVRAGVNRADYNSSVVTSFVANDAFRILGSWGSPYGAAKGLSLAYSASIGQVDWASPAVIYFGARGNGQLPSNGWLRKFVVWPRGINDNLGRAKTAASAAI